MPISEDAAYRMIEGISNYLECPLLEIGGQLENISDYSTEGIETRINEVRVYIANLVNHLNLLKQANEIVKSYAE